MVGQRLKQLRLARGLSLDALVAKMGGFVTKQALSKYELGVINPSLKVINKLAMTLGVKSKHLWSAPNYRIDFIAYRKKSAFPKKEQAQVENTVREELEKRIRLQEITNQHIGGDLPIKTFLVKNIEDSDKAAAAIRKKWNLGLEPIANVCNVLEEHCIHVLEINTNEKFDGIAAVACDENKRVISASVVTRKGVCGERQRLNLSHELGHLVLKTRKSVDEEKSAFRFAGAFLAPAETVYKEVGGKRSFIQIEELMIFKKRFGMSMQAFLHRLHELRIITDFQYTKWFKDINQIGWRKREPNEIPPEKPQWLKQTALRAVGEEKISADEAKMFLGESFKEEPSLSLTNRRAFLKLTMEERREILKKQAENISAHYEKDKNWRETGGGDIVGY